MEITEMQKKMDAAFGHEVEIHLVGGGKPFIGKCINYTKPLDNEPEVASVYIRVPGFSSVYEITEDKIDTIIITDGKK